MREKFYPLSMVNITNRCTLKCKHCFVFRESNPNTPTAKELPPEVMIEKLKEYKKKYGMYSMVWMGGEPLLRKDVLRKGVKIFPRNVITTNGTLPLINLGKKIRWVISLDGPEEVNDEIRGKGTFKKVLSNLNNLPDDFAGALQCQCVITKKNEECFEELIDIIREETPIESLLFSFYVPTKNDISEFTWKNLKERDPAVKKAFALKKKYPKFIRNKEMAFELLLSQNSLKVTNNCPLKKFLLPLYLGDEGFEIPFCCHGNDVNCDMCGSFGVFHLAATIKTNPGFYSNYLSVLK